MLVSRIGIFLALLAMTGVTWAQGTDLVTTTGRSHDEIANCIVRQMPPSLRAFPRISPPPLQDAVVNVYYRGHDQAEDPIAAFYVRGSGADGLKISFQQFSGVSGEFDRIARIAAERCAGRR